jgi:malonyl-CoA O-methyltransferase
MQQMNEAPGRINTANLRRRMDKAAALIDEADVVLQASADGLCERLLPMQISPLTILDLGCGTGARMRQIGRLYPKSRVLGLDMSAAMLKKATARHGWFDKSREIQGEATALPFTDDSIDLVFSNLLLPFVDDLPACLGEVARVLRRDGLFVFSTLGPDSFAELRNAWQQVDAGMEHVRAFADMHLVGDAMVQHGLRDPVLDVDFLDIRYQNIQSLYRDLTATGARNSLAGRRTGLGGRRRLAHLERLVTSSGDGDGATLKLELVYGHAWGSVARSPAGEYRFDAAGIGRRSQ